MQRASCRCQLQTWSRVTLLHGYTDFSHNEGCFLPDLKRWESINIWKAFTFQDLLLCLSVRVGRACRWSFFLEGLQRPTMNDNLQLSNNTFLLFRLLFSSLHLFFIKSFFHLWNFQCFWCDCFFVPSSALLSLHRFFLHVCSPLPDLHCPSLQCSLFFIPCFCPSLSFYFHPLPASSLNSDMNPFLFFSSVSDIPPLPYFLAHPLPSFHLLFHFPLICLSFCSPFLPFSISSTCQLLQA